MITTLMRTFSLLALCSLLISCSPSQLSAPSTPIETSWSIYRHEFLGVEVQYPTGCQVDSTGVFVHFCDTPQATQCFGVVNASFGMKQPADFLAHLAPPVKRTQPLTLDGQPALFVELQPVPESQGIKSVVAVITPYGRELTIDNRTTIEIFDRALASIRFFKPNNSP